MNDWIHPDAVVFAGGGCRCFWQAGFWSTAAPALELRPRAVAAVSAGAAFAAASVGGVIERVVADFTRRVARNRRNVYLGNAVRRRPMFPHYEMYRSAILASMDQATLDRIHATTDLRIVVALPPPRVQIAGALLVGILAYRLDHLTRRRVHPSWPRRLGFSPRIISASSCQTPEELADLILQSSCTPPLTPLFRRGDDIVVDGGIVDNVPVEVVDDAPEALVLLTKRYRRLPRRPGRRYLQPSRPIEIAMWDYTNPRLVGETFDLGRRDGEAFAARLST